MESLKFVKLRYSYLPVKPDVIEEGMTFLEFKRRGLDEILKSIHSVSHVIGHEELNSLGDPTLHHVHIHFSTYGNISSIRTNLTRLWKKEYNDLRVRAALYSLKEETDVKDYDLFFRYPLKQGNEMFQKKNIYPVNFDYAVQRVLAMDQWQRECEYKKAKQNTDLNKESTYSKLKTYLDSFEILEILMIKRYIFRYYLKEQLAMNANTMSGYANTYAAQVGLLTEDDFIMNYMK